MRRATRRVLLATLFLLALAALAVHAVDWEEIAITATPTADGGRAMVMFTVHLQYDAAPRSADLSYGWTVNGGPASNRTEIVSFYRSTTFPGGGVNLYLGSGHVPIEPGVRYVAEVTVDDAANNLHYEGTVTYTAPLILPVGIILKGANGAEEIGLDGVPDEELEEMATAYDLLRTNYTKVEEDVTLDEFFASHVSASGDFPAAVFLIPLQGNESTFGTASSPVTFRITPVMYAYPIEDRAAGTDLLEQLAVYENDYPGTVYEGEGNPDGDDSLFGAKKVFVGDIAWSVLAAAKTEEQERHAAQD